MSEGSDLRLFSWRATNEAKELKKESEKRRKAKTKKRDQKKHQNQVS